MHILYKMIFQSCNEPFTGRNKHLKFPKCMSM